MIESVGVYLQNTCQIMFVFVMYKKSVKQEMEL
jgi:hypothetical protein